MGARIAATYVERNTTEESLMWTLVLYLLLSSGLVYAAGDDGIGIDPNGGARSAACGDAGSGLDPHGRPCP